MLFRSFPRPAWTYENRLLLILFMTFGFVFFDRLALSFLFPFMAAELHLTNAQLGMVSSALALTWALSGAATGAWSDARGTRKPLLIAAVLGFSVFSALSGFVGGFASLIAFRALMGIAEGPVLPLSQSLMIESSTPSRRGLNMGLLQGSAAGLLGAMIGPPVVIGIATAAGWREAFYVSCIPGIAIAFCIWRWVHEAPPGGAIDARADACSATKDTAKGATVSRWALLKARNVLLCVLISCFFLTWFVVVISFAPTFLVSSRHFSASDMGVVMTCLGAAWVFWGFAVPAISDRIGRKPTFVIYQLGSVATVIAYAQLSNPTAMLWAGALMGMFVNGMVGGYGTLMSEGYPTAARATAQNVLWNIGRAIGGLGPMTVGALAARYSFQTAIALLAGLYVLDMVATVFLIPELKGVELE
ncbi:MFS transporter [Burkholderia multivorans]|nr:MFS transporter [Burkholderia multivorans]